MKSSIRIPLVLAAAAFVFSGCRPVASGQVAKSSVAREPDPGIPGVVLLPFADANNAFALDLYTSLRGQAGNLIYSPYSVSAALAMTYAGARGETESQMADSLRFDLPQEQLHAAFNQLDLSLTRAGNSASTSEQPLQLNITNAIWTDKTLTLVEEYLDVIARNYGAGIHLADFLNAFEPARREMNAWISEQTERRIQDLIPEGAVDESTRMVLINAIYFNGDWQHQFDAIDTGDEPFHLLDGSQVQVRMMHAQLPGVAYAAGDGFQAIELPYRGGTAAMNILVPDPGTFEAFEGSLDAAGLREILAAMQPASLQLGLPKFSYGAAFDMGEQLSGLGMPDAFDPDRADFSGMTGGRDLFISKVLHQAFVTVDEKGTEAAAATAVIMGPTSIMLPDLSLVVDRPFIFVIRDLGTGQILFLGRVLDPTQ
ncbi:MAG: serpin family protein [Chloroflexota bacterium]